MTKPTCKLTGTDGNVFALIGKVSGCLKKNGLKDDAKTFEGKAFASKSYDAVLRLISEYVEVS
jgi:hypothetical protein